LRPVAATSELGPPTPAPPAASPPPPTSPASTPPASSTPASTTPASSTATPTSRTTTPSVTPQTSPGPTARGSTAPTGLTATPGDTKVRLSWAAPASDGGSIISYKVYLASHPGVQEGAAIGSSKSTDATVTGLTNGTLYYFMVAAVDSAGNESPLSAEVAAEPTGSHVVPVPPPGPPKWLIALLTAGGAMVVAAALTLIARSGRLF